jgi:hypothetical protein
VAIALIGTTSGASGASAVTLTVPAGVTTSHLGVMITGSADPALCTVTASGWTSRIASPTGQTNEDVHVLTRLGGLSAGNTFTVSFSGGSVNQHVAVAWFDTSGLDVAVVGTPGTRGGTSSANTVIPAVTTTVANQAVIVLATERTTATGTTISSWTGGTPTQDLFVEDSTSTATSHFIGHFTQATAGSTGSRTVTYSGGSGNGTGVMLALSGSADGSGTVNLTGSGTLGVAGQADGTGSVALTGSGALSTAGSSGAGSASLAVAATSFAESASATSLACPVPTGTAAGDLLVALVVGPTNVATTATVTGWTLDKSQGGADSAANDGQTTYYRVATGSEPASYTFTSTGTANRMSVLMARVTGADTTTPLDVATVSSSGAAATTYTAPSITTTTAGAMLLHWVSVNASSTNAMTITPPSGLTQKALTDGSVAAGRKAGLWSEPRPTAGATGTRAWASTTAIQFAGTTMAIRPASTGGGTVTPTLGHRIVGIPTTTTVEIGVRVTNASSVRLKVGTDAGVTSGVVFGAAATPDADGYATLTATGLSAGTRYYYRVAMTPAGGGTEVLDPSATVGTFATAPSGPASFAFNFGSCTNAADSVALAAIAARGDDLFLHLGDLYYDDGTGTSAANILAHQQAKVEATNHQAVMAFTPTAYTPSDHDGMSNNSAAGTDPTAWANFNTVYRKRVAGAAGIPATSGVLHVRVGSGPVHRARRPLVQLAHPVGHGQRLQDRAGRGPEAMGSRTRSRRPRSP